LGTREGKRAEEGLIELFVNDRGRKFGETLGYNIPEANDLIQR